MTIRLIFLCLTALIAVPAAAAEWLRGESKNYVVHAELDEEQMRELVVLIEDFRRMLEGQLPPRTKPGRKAHIYLDKNNRRITRVSDFRNIGFAYSSPEITGAFVVYDPSEKPVFRNSSIFYGVTVNYIDNAFFRPNPPWVRTGVPSFFSTVYIDEEGSFILGAPDVRRPMSGSVSGSKLSKMLTTDYPPRTEKAWSRFFLLSREAIYPLLIEASYAGLLEQYLQAYGSGIPMDEAGLQLGDIDELAEQIQDRRTSSRPTFRRVTLEARPEPGVTIRPMVEDEIALTELRFLRMREDEYADAAAKLRKLTDKLPDSEKVWFEYAAAEFSRVRSSKFGGEPVFRGFGFSNGELIVSANPYSDAEAWRAVNRSLEINPDFAPALRLKGEIMLSRLVKSGETGDADEYAKVRAMLEPVAASPESNPLAAAVLFQSYIEEGLEPPDDVVDLLGRAFVANPGVEEFRYAYAVALVRRGQKDVAQNLLRSILNNPEYTEAAQRALSQTI